MVDKLPDKYRWKVTFTEKLRGEHVFGKSSTQQQVVMDGCNIALLRFKLFPVGFRSYMNLNKWSLVHHSSVSSVYSSASVMFELFTQLKKGSTLFNGINSVSLLNQR